VQDEPAAPNRGRRALINANNFSVSYASAILAGTPQAQLATPQTPKRLKGMTAEAIARMERELSRLQEAISSIHDSNGQDHLHLTVVKGYLRKLITASRITSSNTSPICSSSFKRSPR
jgi:hypothetical protein